MRFGINHHGSELFILFSFDFFQAHGGGHLSGPRAGQRSRARSPIPAPHPPKPWGPAREVPGREVIETTRKSRTKRLEEIYELAQKKKILHYTELVKQYGVSIWTAYQYAREAALVFDDIQFIDGKLIFIGSGGEQE